MPPPWESDAETKHTGSGDADVIEPTFPSQAPSSDMADHDLAGMCDFVHEEVVKLTII